MDADLDGRVREIEHAAYLSVRPWLLLVPREVDGVWAAALGSTDNFEASGLRPNYAFARNPLLSTVAAAQRYSDELSGLPDLGATGYEQRAIDHVQSAVDLPKDSPYVNEFREGTWARDCLRAGLAALRSPDRPDATVQQTFTGMLREQVGPALRELGFVGSGTTFRIPSDSHHLAVAFTKSRFNNATFMKFGASVLGIAKNEVSLTSGQGRASTAMPAPRSADWRLNENLRLLARTNPFDRTSEWYLTRNDATADLAIELVRAIEQHALPRLKHFVASQRPETDPPPIDRTPL